MIKNILFYTWKGGNEDTVIHNLKRLGCHCVAFLCPFTDYHADGIFAQKVLTYIRKEDIHMVLSWDYVPLLASVCEICGLPYAAWIYGCPFTLLSKTVLYEHNYLFCSDREQALQLAGLGCRNVYHYPLGVDAEWFAGIISAGEGMEARHAGEISYVGSLYTERERRLSEEGLSDYVKGYLGGLAEAQSGIYGCSLVKTVLSKEMAEEILKRQDFPQGEMYFFDPVRVAAEFVNEMAAQKERINAVERIAGVREIRVYSHTAYAGNENIRLCGPVSYQEEMPFVFRHSRINLHITSKTIESGIPPHALDIMACGGFCLTNYQPEIAEHFEDGVELVMYTGMEDLAEKAEYYLCHEEERAAIAKAGMKKVREAFSLKEKLARLLRIVEEDGLPLP